MADSILPSLDAIQARADARRDYSDERPESLHVPKDYAALADESAADVPALVKALRAALAVAAPHTEWLARREAKLGRAESCACDTCKIVRAVTAHIDTTPKEKP